MKKHLYHSILATSYLFGCAVCAVCRHWIVPSYMLYVASHAFCLYYCQHSVLSKSRIVFALLLMHSVVRISPACILCCIAFFVYCIVLIVCVLCILLTVLYLIVLYYTYMYIVNVVQALCESCIVYHTYIVCIMYCLFLLHCMALYCILSV